MVLHILMRVPVNNVKNNFRFFFRSQCGCMASEELE